MLYARSSWQAVELYSTLSLGKFYGLYCDILQAIAQQYVISTERSEWRNLDEFTRRISIRFNYLKKYKAKLLPKVVYFSNIYHKSDNTLYDEVI